MRESEASVGAIEDCTLEEVNVVNEISEALSDSLTYPCVIFSGINTTQELKFFASRKGNAKKSVPMFLKFENMLKRIGSFELSLDNLLACGMLGDYVIDVYPSAGKHWSIDQHNPQDLLKFVTIGG